MTRLCKFMCGDGVISFMLLQEKTFDELDEYVMMLETHRIKVREAKSVCIVVPVSHVSDTASSVGGKTQSHL